MSETVDVLKEAKKSLTRIQDFDVKTLSRTQQLGTELSFSEIILPAQRVIDLYRRIAIAALDDFPEQILVQIRDYTNTDYSKFQDVLKYNPSEDNAGNNRRQLIEQIKQRYTQVFQFTHPYISYSVQKTTDLGRFENEVQAVLQRVRDQTEEIKNDLENQKIEAQNTLAEIRAVAAEQGVSQQAIYFKDEHDSHIRNSKFWLICLCVAVPVLLVYAISSIKLYSYISPQNVGEIINLAVSKVLIFGTLSFIVFFCARNYNAHKHNAIVNKHRQNALVTYRSIVEAAKDTTNVEQILIQASSCIFSPQETGYSNGNGKESGMTFSSVVELLNKSGTES